MPLVNLPDGTQANFPDTMANSDIEAAIAKNYPQFAPKSTGTKVVDSVDAFLDAVGNKIPFMNKVPNTWGGDENAAQTAINQNTADHPIANTAGGIVGSTLPYIAGGAVAAGAKLPLVGKALVNGGIGAAQGVADTDVDPNASAMDKITAYLKGGAVGAAGGIAGELGGNYAGNLATKMAPKVIGATKSIVSDMTPAARQKLGVSLLNPVGDEEKVITPFASADTMMDRVQNNKKLNGGLIGDARARADAIGNSFDTMGAAHDISNLRSNVPTAPINMAGDHAVNQGVDNVLEYGSTLGDPNGNLSLVDAGQLKSQYGNLADYKPSSLGEVPVNDANKAITAVLKKYIDNGILPEDLTGYQQANQGYSNALNAQDALTNKINSEVGNNKIGLPVKTALAIGSSSLDPTKIIAPLVVEAADRRGGTAMVSGLDAAGKSNLGIVPQTANDVMSTINDYLNQSQPGHPNQQGSDQSP